MKRTKTRRRRRDGFTLIEVLLVLAILGVIAAMVVPNMLGQQQQSYIKTTKLNIKSLESTVERYALNHDGEYPENLNVLLQPENTGGTPIPAYLDTPPADAWGMPLKYEPQTGPGQKPIITSFGPNKQEGGGDDISNFDDQQEQQI